MDGHCQKCIQLPLIANYQYLAIVLLYDVIKVLSTLLGTALPKQPADECIIEFLGTILAEIGTCSASVFQISPECSEKTGKAIEIQK